VGVGGTWLFVCTAICPQRTKRVGVVLKQS
jgi:hypothetical protein